MSDCISYADYITQKDAFWKRNRYRDSLMDFNEYRTIPGFKSDHILQIGDFKPSCISSCKYVLWTLLMMAQIYKKYVDSFCIYQSFKVRKLISTRFNLLSPLYNEQYKQIAPALNLTGPILAYEQNSIGFCSRDFDVKEPTQDDYEKALQYEKKIPRYKMDSVGGASRVVKEGLNVEENYNVPPPAFENLGGDVVLSENVLMNRRGNSDINIAAPTIIIPVQNNINVI